jgi:hypothetical protein
MSVPLSGRSQQEGKKHFRRHSGAASDRLMGGAGRDAADNLILIEIEQGREQNRVT